MKTDFYKVLQSELDRIDNVKTTKRHEKVITGFTKDHKAIVNGQEYLVFNSNDYLGLRFDEEVKKAEHEASNIYGAGPGSVRFIAGTYKVYKDLESALAKFHGRDDAMVFSSAFAANLAVIFCLIKGQSKDSLVSGSTLVISDSLNHRSIIDGVRVANVKSEQKAIYKHLDYADLERILNENKGKFDRVLVISDGIFSMLGEQADIKMLKTVIDKFDGDYKEGIILFIDDSHGVGSYGATGRGVEEVSEAKCDVLVGTLGKAFGADGGYVVADQIVIDYLRESAATYIYSNSISPSVAGAALESVQTIDTEKGKQLLALLNKNISYFKTAIQQAGFTLASDSQHAIQPILVGDTAKAKLLAEGLFKSNILVTTISYPVVSPGRDEIRVQINSLHTEKDLQYFIDVCTRVGKEIGLIK
jgi:glycine C-acetyltransferase